MSAITLRNLSPEVLKIIRRRAMEGKTSINKVVVGVLEECLGLTGHRRNVVHHDLDHVIGSWTRQQADQFERTLTAQRQIDRDLWK